MFIDTHCHIHDSEFFSEDEADVMARRAIENGVTKLVCVGTDEKSSRSAVEFSDRYAFCYAVVGVHPHDTKNGIGYIEQMLKDHHKTVVGVGEIGLDYFYDNSPRDVQTKALEQQLQWAIDYQLPVSFHVREAFADFWPIYRNFSGIKGVLHSFTDTLGTLETALAEGLYLGVNGISTFAREKIEMWDSIPLERMLLETDAPFLTPVPHRGKVNEPAFVRHVAEYHANRRKVELETFARVTSANATTLFSLT